MNEDAILQFSKELTLNYLDEINADVNEKDGIYYVIFPLTVAKLFGGDRKKITFNPDVAAIHAYELVVPGSNFLSTVIREVQKQAPVVVGSIPKNIQNTSDIINKINVKNSQIELVEQNESERLGIRFYFHITLQSIKNVSSLRWIDFDLKSLTLLELPYKLNFNTKNLKLNLRDKKFDDAYTRAIEEFENDTMPQVEKYVGLTQQNKDDEIGLLNIQEQKRLKEIKDELKNEENKLEEFDRRMLRAKSANVTQKYFEKKENFKSKIKKMEKEAVKHIEKIGNDKQTALRHIIQKYKPSLTFSLLAAQVYSYSVLDCVLSIQKGDKSTRLKAQYVDPTANCVTYCDICQSENETIHLCENLHVTCDNCIKNCLNCNNEFCLNCISELRSCYICKDEFCDNCSKTCEFCFEITCNIHATDCLHCSKFSCYFCSETCEFCSRRFCNQDLYKCTVCDALICDEDSNKCGICNKISCVTHVTNCQQCSELSCDHCSETCRICSRRFCNQDLYKCTVCDALICDEDSNKCGICNKISCVTHVTNCQQCSELSCDHCSETCGICSRRFCNNDIKKCTTCQISSCENDSKKCGICNNLFCTTHYETCGICMKLHCDFDAKTCKICKCKYSSNCVEKDHCNTCHNLKSSDRNHPQIKELIQKYDQYKKYKNWEFGMNSKYMIFKIKKFLGSKIIVVQRNTMQIIRGN